MNDWKYSTKVTENTVDSLGERIALSNGSLSFELTDDVYSGRGLDIVLTRSASHRGDRSEAPVRFAGNWEYTIPHIKTTSLRFSSGPSIGAWHNEQNDLCSSSWMFNPYYTSHEQINGGIASLSASTANKGLSGPGGPMGNLGARGPEYIAIATHQFYQGIFVNVPWQISEQLIAGKTRSGWKNECITSADSNFPFANYYQITSPNGTSYTFKQPVAIVNRVIGQSNWVIDDYLLVTKIEDKLGNTLIYNYTSDSDNGLKLNSISASDNRRVEFSHKPDSSLITSADFYGLNENGSEVVLRTWTYQQGTTISSGTVTRPDNSTWTHNFTDWVSTLFSCGSAVRLSVLRSTTHPKHK